MLNKLLEIGFLTGSRAFGTHDKTSDYDVVYLVYDEDHIQYLIKEYVKIPSNYFSGYKIQDGDKVINLIPVTTYEYLPWYLATKAMTHMLKQSGITDKVKKHSVFMGIVSLFKGTINQDRDIRDIQKMIKHDIASETYGFGRTVLRILKFYQKIQNVIYYENLLY